MYSVVLLTALTLPPATQGHCFRGACHGGGHGYSSCSGYGSGYGCGGYSGYGCGYGGHGHGRGNGYGHGYRSHGGSGYVNSWSCFGGGYHGYHDNAWSNYGCGYGCYSGGYYGYGYGGASVICSGCYGCYGGHSCYGSPTTYAYPEAAAPSQPYNPGIEAPRKPDVKPGKVEQTPLPKNEQARARITIEVPADAKLFIDGQLMQASSTRRTFQTPDLTVGQAYFYDVRVEVTREGKVVSDSQRIILRPGAEATANFASLGQNAPPALAQTGEQ